MKRRKVVVGVLIVFVLLLVIGTSYALWQIVLKQTGTNTLTTGCFQLSLTDEGSAITLNDAYPLSDEEGHGLDSYNFTITNTCSTDANYVVNLETLTSGLKKLPEKYLKTSLMSEGEEVFFSTLIARFENIEKGMESASKAFKLYEGSLGGNSSKTFDLRLWLDSNTPFRDEVMEAMYEGKIVVIASLADSLNMDNMMISKQNLLENGDIDYNSNNFDFFSDSHQIIFEEENSAIDGIDGVDISKNKTGSVMAYVDRSNPDNIVTHIRADGTILFPENVSFYFSGMKNLTSIVGLESVNTSYVTDMSYMFDGVGNITSLNLSGWDLSSVLDMQNMFMDTSGLTNLNLSNWRFSKNTSLDGLFHGCNPSSTIESIDLSGWDVTIINMETFFDDDLWYVNNVKNLNLSNWYVNPQVMIDVYQTSLDSGMEVENLNLSNWAFTAPFNNASAIIPFHRGVTNLDLSNWDISMIDDFSEIFRLVFSYESDFPSLTSLDLSGWDTTYVTDMSGMFENFPSLVNLNISSFDTTNVKNLSYMFSGCSALTNITYGPKFVYDTSKNIEGMFDNTNANKPTDASWDGVLQ